MALEKSQEFGGGDCYLTAKILKLYSPVERLKKASDWPLVVLSSASFCEGVWNVSIPSIFPIGVGSMTFPDAFPHANIGLPSLKMIDLMSTSLVPFGFMRMLCVLMMNPVALPLIFPDRVMSSTAPFGLKSLTLTEVAFSFPSKSISFSIKSPKLILMQHFFFENINSCDCEITVTTETCLKKIKKGKKD